MYYDYFGNVNPETISTGLLQQLKLNEDDAWTRTVNLYSPLIFFWCRRGGLQPSDAEDIVQKVFNTVKHRLPDFERSKGNGSFRGWLRTITRHKIGDHSRAFRRRKTVYLTDYIQNSYEAAQEDAFEQDGKLLEENQEMINSETHILFNQILKMIKEEFAESTWKAFLKVVVDGLAPKDAAEDLNLSVNSVYLAKSRVLRRIRDEFGHELPQ